MRQAGNVLFWLCLWLYVATSTSQTTAALGPCADGTYTSGSTCVPCNSNCVNKLCDSNDGTCTYGCLAGYHGAKCTELCSRSIKKCTHCIQDGRECIACSDWFQPPRCTGCQDDFYKSGSTCVPCVDNCGSRHCDRDSGKCILLNVAPGKTYSQSSTTDPASLPSHAANKNKGAVYDTSFPNCIHTADSDFTPWWEVNLGRRYTLSDFTIWSETNNRQGLYPLNITVDGQLCVRATSPGGVRSQLLRCDSPIYGQVVRLTRDFRDTGSNISLVLCELEIWCCIDGRFGDGCDAMCSSVTPGCSKCFQSDGQCADCDQGYYLSGSKCIECSSNCVNRLCEPESGKCTSGCLTGRHGDTCDSLCSATTTRCTECVQDDGTCTACSGNFKSPQCADCQDGYFLSGTTCVQCSDCVNQQCDSRNGSCTLGCPVGYYGEKCDSQCSTKTPQCTQCDQDGGQCTACSGHYKPPQCTDCDDGYYKSGTTCVECSSNCVNRQCDPASGKCTPGCPTGRYGDTCDSLCSANAARCTECVQDGGTCTACSGNFKSPQCTDCQDGYFLSGTTCVQCSNCVNQQCDSKNGSCTLGCPVGYYGEKCDSQCSTKTPQCTQCDQDGGQCIICSGQFKPPQCTDCDDGYYRSGTTCVGCSSNCVNRQCDPASGKCTPGCPTGRYGDTCDSLCSANTARCTECVQDGGTCTACSGNFKSSQCTDCQDGYFLSGTTCVQCRNCVNQQCDSKSGSCTLGCPVGYYGERCDSECSTKTPRCTQCDQDGGQCTTCVDQFKPPQCTDCDDGYYKSGTKCVHCSSNCVNRQCDPASGKCTPGCPTGRYGDTCDSLCSASTARCTECEQDGGTCTACSGNFKSPLCTDCQDGYFLSGNTCLQCNYCVNQQCDSKSGSCTLGCPVGYYGERCDSHCSTKTPRCTQCDQDGGQCTTCSGHYKPPQCTACDDGYYKSGTTCVECSSNCVNRQCDPASGKCTPGCPTGRYGDTCDSLCSANAARCTECVQDGGTCTACSGNFKSPQCTDCQDGYFLSGSTCVQCSNCVNQKCDSQSGSCTLGCPEGFYGDKCYSRCAVLTPGCIQCVQEGGQCTVCSGNVKPPQCTETLGAEMERLVAPLIGAVAGSIVGVGLLIGIILTAVFCRQLKSKRSARKASVNNEASSVPSPWGHSMYPAYGARRTWMN